MSSGTTNYASAAGVSPETLRETQLQAQRITKTSLIDSTQDINDLESSWRITLSLKPKLLNGWDVGWVLFC